MTPTETNQTVIRYSLKPIDDYTRAMRGGIRVGPAQSSMLRTPETWNLAYLSFDFETGPLHPDPEFTINVRRTVQARLDGSGPDLSGTEDPTRLVQSLLRLPAPRFVYLIERHPVLKSLPMYVAYGQSWLDTMNTMSRRCLAEELPPDNVVDFSQAKALLAKFK